MRKIKIIEDVQIGDIILEAGDKIQVLEAGDIQPKDWDRMMSLTLSDKDGSNVARSIKDKNKAIARYVAGTKLSGRDNEFSAFYDKAIELGATKEEIESIIIRTEIPQNVIDKFAQLKTKKLNNRFVGVISKAILKMGFDIDFLPHNGYAITPGGKQAMSSNGRKWTIGYKTEINTGTKKINFSFDAVTDEGDGPTHYIVDKFDDDIRLVKTMGQREFLTWLNTKLSEYR